MKRFHMPSLLLVLLMTALTYMQSIAQPCNPNPSYTTPGIYPSYLPKVEIGIAYSGVVDFKVPTDTTVPPISATFDSLKIEDVKGLPAGFSYSCNIPSCAWVGGSNGCAAIIGTADSSLIGEYPLKVMVRSYLDVLGAPLDQKDSVERYVLYVGVDLPDSITGIKLQPAPAQSLRIYPSLLQATQNTLIVEHPTLTKQRQDLSVRVHDITGRTIPIQWTRQGQYIQIALGDVPLSSGLYLVEVRVGNTLLLNGKVLKQ